MLSLMVTLLLAPAPVEPPADTPKGPPPRLVTVQVDREGNLVAHQTRTSYVTEARTVQENVGGRVVQRTAYLTVPVTTTVAETWKLDKATISEAGGKKLDAKELKKRITGPTTVVVSSDGKPIEKAYLRLFTNSTIVVVAPVATPAPGTTAPRPRAMPGAKK